MDTGVLQRRFSRLALAYAGTLLLVLVVVGAVALVTRSAVAADQDRLAPAQIASRTLATGVADQETGERGFLITTDPQYLEPYANGRAVSIGALDMLRGVLDDEEGRAHVADVEQRLQEWQAVADREIDVARTEGADAAQALVATGEAKSRFDELRAGLGRLDALVDRRVADQRERIDTATMILLILLCVGFVSAAVLAVLSARAFRRWNALRSASVAWNEDLVRASVAMSGVAADLDRLAQCAAEHGHRLLGARYVNLATVDRRGVIEVLADQGLRRGERLGTFLDVAPGTDGPAPIPDAVRTGAPVTVPDAAALADRYPALAGAVAPGGIEAWIVVPLRNATGGVIGTIGAAYDHPLPGRGDVARAQLEALSELVAQNVARVRWTMGAETLALLARRLGDAATIDEVAVAVAEDAWRAVDAFMSTMAVRVAPDSLRMSPHPGLDPEITARYDTFPVDAPLPLAGAVRTGEPVVLESPADGQRVYPHLGEDRDRAGVEASVSVPVTVSGEIVGAIGLGWSRPIRYDTALRARVETLVELVSRAIDRAERLDAAGQLGTVAGEFGAAVGIEAVARVVTDALPRPVRATWAALGVFDDRDGVIRLFSRRPLPGLRADADGWYRLELERPGEWADVVGATEPVWSRPHFDAARAPLAPGIEHAGGEHTGGEHTGAAVPGATATGLEVMVSVPLFARAQRLGLLVLAWDQPLAPTAELKERIDTLSRFCEQSLGRAVLHESTAQVALLAQHMAAALSVEAVVEILHQWLPAVMRARAGRVGLLDELTGTLTITSPGDGVGANAVELVARYDDLPPRANPLVDAMRRAELVVVADQNDLEEQYPNLVGDASSQGVTGLVAAPVQAGDGRVVGVVAVAWSDTAPDAPGAQALLRTVAELTGQTLERIRLGGIEHDLTTRIAQRLAGPPARIEGMEIAARYRPALTNLALGGDWYQVIDRDDGTVAVVVGDVIGHGVDAAADMAQLRTTIATLLRLGVDLSEVFHVLDPLITPEPDVLGTAMVAIVDRSRGEVRVATAGHPPPLIRVPGRPTRILDTVARHPLLGMGADVHPVEPVAFPPGATLIAYTDGLVERRRQSIDDGIAAISAIADAHTGASVAELADALVAYADDSDNADDVALVVLSWRREPA